VLGSAKNIFFLYLVYLCDGPFVLLGLGLSCCTTTHRFEVRKLGLA